MTTALGLPFDALVRLSRRSWWEAKYLGGRTIGEWQTAGEAERLAFPRLRLQAKSNWQDLDHSRIVAARLWCPSGEIGEVEAPGPYRIFQFKSGFRSAAGDGSIIDSHTLGVVVDDAGGCQCWEWDGRCLRSFADNVQTLHLRYGQGPFNLDVIGLRL